MGSLKELRTVGVQAPEDGNKGIPGLWRYIQTDEGPSQGTLIAGQEVPEKSSLLLRAVSLGAIWLETNVGRLGASRLATGFREHYCPFPAHLSCLSLRLAT